MRGAGLSRSASLSKRHETILDEESKIQQASKHRHLPLTHCGRDERVKFGWHRCHGDWMLGSAAQVRHFEGCNVISHSCKGPRVFLENYERRKVGSIFFPHKHQYFGYRFIYRCSLTYQQVSNYIQVNTLLPFLPQML